MPGLVAAHEHGVMTSLPMLGCTDVAKSFHGRTVLRHMTLSVQPGRVYALLGRNGAGKSTTLRILLGLLEPDAGEVYLLGRPFERAALGDVGATIDGPALY